MEFFLSIILAFSDLPAQAIYYQYQSFYLCNDARVDYVKDNGAAAVEMGETVFGGKNGRLISATCVRGQRPAITQAQRTYDQNLESSIKKALERLVR